MHIKQIMPGPGGGPGSGRRCYVVKSPNNYNEATAYSPARHLARASDGALWCCYAGPQLGQMQVFVSYSIDNGVSWTEEQVTADALNDHEYPSIAIDSADNIHLAWQGGRIGPGWEIYYRQRSAGVWGAVENVTAIGTVQNAPSIAVDSADNIHLVWPGTGWGGNPIFRNIQYRQRAAGVWGVQESVSDIASWQLWDSASIAIDAADIIHVVWSGFGWGGNPGDYNIQYRQRVAGVWGVQEVITDLATWNHMPCIALDSAGNVHVVWYAETLFGAIWDIFYRERIAGIWQAPVQLTTMGGIGADQYQPSIAIDSSDNVHIVWYGSGWGIETGNYNLQHFKRTVGVWAQEALTDRAWDQQFPSLLWAFHPLVGGVRPNILADYAYVFTAQDAPAVLRIEYCIVT